MALGRTRLHQQGSWPKPAATSPPAPKIPAPGVGGRGHVGQGEEARAGP